MDAGFGCPDDAGAGQSLCSELVALRRFGGAAGPMERDTLLGTVNPEAGRALASSLLSPNPCSLSFPVPPSSEKEQ